jgi:hypothetical protein
MLASVRDDCRSVMWEDLNAVDGFATPDRQQRARYAGSTGVAGPSQHLACGALYGASAGPVQVFLAVDVKWRS